MPQLAALGLHPVARRLLLINRPRKDGTLSWRWYTPATGGNYGLWSNPRPRDRKSGTVPLGHHVHCFVNQKQIVRSALSSMVLYSSWARQNAIYLISLCHIQLSNARELRAGRYHCVYRKPVIYAKVIMYSCDDASSNVLSDDDNYMLVTSLVIRISADRPLGDKW